MEGQRFYVKLHDGKIHECVYVEKYVGSRWIAKVIDDHGGYKKGQTFICDAGYK
jgi:hypothetical protein